MLNNKIPSFDAFRGKFQRICPRGVFTWKGEDLTCTEIFSDIVVAASKSDRDPKSARFAADMIQIFDIGQSL